MAEIITLRAIALKLVKKAMLVVASWMAEIITLRAIALKQDWQPLTDARAIMAEIITLRAIALKPVLEEELAGDDSAWQRS